MIVDGYSVADGEVLSADVCIVGGGVSGISLARELMSKNIKVCILESGDTEARKEHVELNEGKNIGLEYYPLDSSRGRQVGGSPGRWVMEIGNERLGARLRPFSPIDFESRDWVPNSGWPFDYSHIEPYFERAHKLCDAGEYKYSVNDYKLPRKMAPLPFDPAEVETAIYQFVPRDHFVKQSLVDFNRADNVTLVKKANALEVEMDADGAVSTGVKVGTLNGNKFSVSAKVVVLAIGGIETPRLLLNSTSTWEQGVGNQNDIVGRYFMEHPHLWSGLIVPNDRDAFKYSELYDKEKMGYRSKNTFLGQLVLPDEVLRREKMLSYACHIMPSPRPRKWNPGDQPPGVRKSIGSGILAVKHLVAAARDGDLSGFNRHISSMFPVGNELSIAVYRAAAKRFNKMFRDHKRFEVYKMNHMTEQEPNPDSRVMLSAEKDALGLNRVNLDWRLTELDIWSIRRAQQLIHNEAVRCGFGIVENCLEDNSVPESVHGGYHHMGTTRMHDDPRKGVVDRNCKIHDIENVFVAGSPVFPTGGYANPVLTAVALTARLGDHLKSNVFN